MKSMLLVITAIGLLLMPFAVSAQSEQNPKETPPISQPLIREGDFALKLVDALKIGTAQNEAEAETMLTSSGIAPRNGWIADYPVTPDIIGELQNAIGEAADSGGLALNKDEATKVLQNLTGELGLPIVADTSGKYAGTEPPGGYGEYSNPSVINDYYYSEGPPVVTYYPPPWDYGYMYAWVPSPFWCSGFFFPGFFVLNDFDIVVRGHHGHHHHITNHFTDPKTRTVLRVDPTGRTSGRTVKTSLYPHQGFYSTESRKGATSIFERSRTRQMAPTHATPGGPSGDQVPMNRERARPSTIERGTIQNRGSRNLGSYSVPNNVQRRSEGSSRSFAAPSRSLSAPRSSFGGFHSGSLGGFHGGGFSGGVSHGGFSGGGCRGRC